MSNESFSHIVNNVQLIYLIMRPYLTYRLNYLRGRYRLKFGFCPMCNSDAPELYDCPCCNYYSSASGDKFPPLKPTKDKWWKIYHDTIITKKNIQLLVLKSRCGKLSKAAKPN